MSAMPSPQHSARPALTLTHADRSTWHPPVDRGHGVPGNADVRPNGGIADQDLHDDQREHLWPVGELGGSDA